MDARALSPEEARELALLRRRAYGPDPDIDADPDARTRLDRLESLRRTPRADAEDASPPAPSPRVPTEPPREPARREPARWAPRAAAEPTPSSAAGPTPSSAAGPTPSSAAGPAPTDASADAAPTDVRRPREHATRLLRWARARHRRAWVIAVSVALVAAMVWTATQAVLPRADLTLGRIPAGDAARDLSGQVYFASHAYDVAAVQRYEDYGALQIWLTTSQSGERCLVVDADDYGVVGIGCTPPGLDPIVDVRIWRGMRQDIFGGLPAGTVLRFQQTQDRVYLWVRQLPAAS